MTVEPVPCMSPPVQLRTCPAPTVTVPVPASVPPDMIEPLVPDESASVRVPFTVRVTAFSCTPATVMFDAFAIVGAFVALVMHAYCVVDGAPVGDQLPPA